MKESAICINGLYYEERERIGLSGEYELLCKGEVIAWTIGGAILARVPRTKEEVVKKWGESLGIADIYNKIQ